MSAKGPTPKRHINLPGFGPLHIAAFIPVALLGMTIVGVVVFAVVDMTLHPPSPEERAERKAKRAAEEAEKEKKEERAEKEKRKRMGYIDDPEVHKTAEAVIKSSGYSCPGVHGVRSMGDKGRGSVLRVQCKNNVFFALTVLPDGQGFTVEIIE